MAEIQLLEGLKDNAYLQGMKGPAIESLQRSLQKWGFDPGPLDGLYGVETTAAVVALQRKLGIEPNGNMDAYTQEAVNVDLARPEDESALRRMGTVLSLAPSLGATPPTYTVRSGDSLTSIALKTGLCTKGPGNTNADWADCINKANALASWNNIPDANQIRVGQTLTLSPGTALAPFEPAPLVGALPFYKQPWFVPTALGVAVVAVMLWPKKGGSAEGEPDLATVSGLDEELDGLMIDKPKKKRKKKKKTSLAAPPPAVEEVDIETEPASDEEAAE